MSNSTISITVDLISNLLAALADIIALAICLTFLCIILHRPIRIKYNHDQATIEVPLILCINTLCIIIIKATVQIIHVTIPTLMKDFQIINEYKETLFCQFRAYIYWSMVGMLYWSYVLLAFFRFARSIYPAQLWLHRSSFYLYILIPTQFLCVFILLLPLLFPFDSLHLLPNEAYCSIAIKPFYTVCYISIFIFGLPYQVMCIFYLCIAWKIRQMSIVRRYQERNRRDYMVMRRILLNIVILSIVSVPVFTIYIIDIIRDRFSPLLYRVQWLASSLSSCLFSLILPLITVQLRNLFKQKKSQLLHNKT